MSDPLHNWYSVRDLEALGEREGSLSGAIELRRMTRLRDLLSMTDGSVRASLRFRQRSGRLVVELDYHATLTLVCQRCLEPLVRKVSEHVEMALVESPSMEPHLPEGCEPLVLEGDRLLPSELIEDELIVSLPMAPRHARIEECGNLARSAATGGALGRSPSTSH